MRYFKKDMPIETAKTLFRTLMKKHHPHVGGKADIAKAITSEYAWRYLQWDTKEQDIRNARKILAINITTEQAEQEELAEQAEQVEQEEQVELVEQEEQAEQAEQAEQVEQVEQVEQAEQEEQTVRTAKIDYRLESKLRACSTAKLEKISKVTQDKFTRSRIAIILKERAQEETMKLDPAVYKRVIKGIDKSDPMAFIYTRGCFVYAADRKTANRLDIFPCDMPEQEYNISTRLPADSHNSPDKDCDKIDTWINQKPFLNLAIDNHNWLSALNQVDVINDTTHTIRLDFSEEFMRIESCSGEDSASLETRTRTPAGVSGYFDFNLKNIEASMNPRYWNLNLDFINTTKSKFMRIEIGDLYTLVAAAATPTLTTPTLSIQASAQNLCDTLAFKHLTMREYDHTLFSLLKLLYDHVPVNTINFYEETYDKYKNKSPIEIETLERLLNACFINAA